MVCLFGDSTVSNQSEWGELGSVCVGILLGCGRRLIA